MSSLTQSLNIDSAITKTLKIVKPGEYILDINPVAGTVSATQRGRDLPSFGAITSRVTKVVALAIGDLNITTTGGSVNVDVYLDKVEN